MDVQMDPCMQTSRIRHDLSSVQLFVERCLMNLEPRVSPAAINAKQWAWMKRYRVWEANRKVYLFPENWLEPELRDDKSPFFKEVESELLQSDITEDSAATALLNYLSKLEEIAKLEPCGIYYIPPDPNKRTGEINHVVARTAGAHRKYYYRRYEYGYWTPWEQIKLDIEDNPVTPVVWNDRLFLFWLRILKQTPFTPPKTLPPGTKMADADASQMIPSEAPKLSVQAVLCWSEYYNGKWQATKTSDVSLPTLIDTLLPSAFNRADLHLGVLVEGDALRISTKDPTLSPEGIADLNDPQKVKWYYVKKWPGSFLLYNTHSLPVPGDEGIKLGGLEIKPLSLERECAGDCTSSLSFKYTDLQNQSLTRDILTPTMRFQLLSPRHELADAWTAPFFLEDHRHVFYVTSEQQPVWVANHTGFGVSVNPGVMNAPQIPPLVVQAEPPVPPKSWGDEGPIGPDPGVIDRAPMQRFVTEDANIRQGIGTTGVVMFGDRQIGPSGAITNLQAGK